MKMEEGKIRYSVASYGYMTNRYYKPHFEITTSKALNTFWESIQEKNGAVIVDRGRFSDSDLCLDVCMAVSQMNLAGKYYPGLIKKILSEKSIFA